MCWSCACVFRAVGHKVYGPQYREQLSDIIRRAAEFCDCLQCFFLIHSMGGGMLGRVCAPVYIVVKSCGSALMLLPHLCVCVGGGGGGAAALCMFVWLFHQIVSNLASLVFRNWCLTCPCTCNQAHTLVRWELWMYADSVTPFCTVSIHAWVLQSNVCVTSDCTAIVSTFFITAF